MDKQGLSERNNCTKFIMPVLRQAGWDEMLQIREEVGFTKGRNRLETNLATADEVRRSLLEALLAEALALDEERELKAAE